MPPMRIPSPFPPTDGLFLLLLLLHHHRDISSITDLDAAIRPIFVRLLASRYARRYVPDNVVASDRRSVVFPQHWWSVCLEAW
jgi:hypothetical protein